MIWGELRELLQVNPGLEAKTLFVYFTAAASRPLSGWTPAHVTATGEDMAGGPPPMARDSSPSEHISPSSSSRLPVRRAWPHAASDLESVKQLLERLGRR